MSDEATSRAEPFFIGVDGGGSKTLAVIVDARGVECGRGAMGGSNYHAAGLESAVAAVHESVRRARQSAQCRAPLAAAWVGLAGVDHPGDVALLAPRLAPIAETVRLTNDAELALSGLSGGVGVALIAGTGSIAIGRNAAEKTARASGWGHLLGDEGSGYDIGLRALRSAVRAADGRGPRTLLLERILAMWRLNAPEDLLASVYENPEKARVARLAGLVIASARKGDRVSRAILHHAADELALAVRAVVAALELNPPVALALGGGLLVHQLGFRRLVLKRVDRALPVEVATIVEEPALQAARFLAAWSASSQASRNIPSAESSATRRGVDAHAC